MTELKDLLAQCGVKLYDSEIVNENGRTIFRIFIIKDGGVTLDDCENVSRLVSPIYDVLPPVSGEWTLEISSPGLERKLTKIEHFAMSLGEFVKFNLKDKSNFDGKIEAVNGDDILLTNGRSIKFDEIKSAKTFIEW